MRAINLKTEHLVDPRGIDVTKPFLSWNCCEGNRQSAWQIKARDSTGLLLWDSKKRQGNETRVLWEEEPLKSREEVYWSVRLWNEADEPGEWSREACFELGLLRWEDWAAQWINPEQEMQPGKRQPASYLRKSFSIEDLGKARLYATAHGIYDIWINREHVDGYLLAPGSSQYDRRLQVQTYDVTNLLHKGDNEILVTVGDGWYRGSVHYGMLTDTFGTDIAFLMQLEIDGQPAVVTDGSWEASQNGPLGMNDHMMGEEYDARKNPVRGWHGVEIMDFGFDNLVGTDTPPVVGKEIFHPRLIHTPAGETVLDFGQVIAGIIRFRLTAGAGDRLILTHGETLDENGNFTTKNFQNPQVPRCFQRVVYTCRDGENSYQNTKCYFGFRYVRVEGDVPITGEEFEAQAIYSDMEQTGYFTCGNEDVNHLFQNALWSMKGNFVDVPTDCPTREKSGYSGDAQVFCHTAMYLMDCWPVLTRWLREQEATQSENGCVKQIAPDGRVKDPLGAYNGGAGWCDSFEIVSWRLARRYNDNTFLEKHYGSIRKWMMFCLNRAKKTRLIDRWIPKKYWEYFADQGVLWGEWLEPGQNMGMKLFQFAKIAIYGEPEVSTAYLSYGCRILSDIARRIGRTEDEAFFLDASKKARAAYRFRYLKKGSPKSNFRKRQCRYVRPLALGLLNTEEKKQFAAELAQNIRENGNHLNTGFLTTHELCRVLTDNGQIGTAYDLLLQTERPGWLYAVRHGATTMLESWDGMDDEGHVKDSFNHYSYGSVAGWLFDRVCGIVVENGEILLRPWPDRRLKHAKAVYHSPLGTIVSSWKYEENILHFDFTVPSNQQARIILPDGGEYKVNTGEHHFEIEGKE